MLLIDVIVRSIVASSIEYNASSMLPIIVIPTYNERENISELLHEIFALNISELQVIIVDDNSPDGTLEIVTKLQKKYPIHIISRAKKSGLGSAYKEGFTQAIKMKADYIFEMDADFSHDPNDIPKLIEAIKKSDIVIASRRVKGSTIVGWNMKRHIISYLATRISRFWLGLKPKDVTSGFRIYRAKALQKLDYQTFNSSGFAFQEEILFYAQKSNLKIIEIPVTFTDRQRGKTKLGLGEMLDFIKLLFRKNRFM